MYIYLYKVHYLMYGAENNMIQGVTQSIYQSFGIPSSLTYGNNTNNNEFTIDAIFPDFFDKNEEDLKSLNGRVLTLDTTNLRQNYLIGSNQNDEEESIYRESLDEVGNKY